MSGGFVERDGVGESGEVVGCGLDGEGAVGDVLHVGDDGVDGDLFLRCCEERGGEEDGGGGEFHDCGQRRGGRASEIRGGGCSSGRRASGNRMSSHRSMCLLSFSLSLFNA